MARFASDNKQRYLRNEIPAASDEWFDEGFTSTQKKKQASQQGKDGNGSGNGSGYRPSKFTTTDLLRHIKSKGAKKDDSKNDGDGGGGRRYDEDLPGLLSPFVFRNLPPLSDFPVALKARLAAIAGVALTALFVLHSFSSSSSSSVRGRAGVAAGFYAVDDDRGDGGGVPRAVYDTAASNGNAAVDPGAVVAIGLVPGPLYYNVESDLPLPQPLSYRDYPPDGPVIALLVTNRTKDVDELTTALRSLAFLRGDKDPNHKAPVLCFHEGDLDSKQIRRIAGSTDRPIAFPVVDFTEFPKGFDPDDNFGGGKDGAGSDKKSKHFQVKGRKAWGYYQMIRFWVTGIWKHPAINHFGTIMRIDSDSCFKDVNDYLPNFMHDDLYYHSQYVGFENGAEYVSGLYDFALKYLKTVRNPSEPRNVLLWHFATTVWTTMDTLPLFRTNFEVSRRSFMQRGDVAHWHEALTEQEPFGVFRHRWGDAVTRFLTASIFVNQDRVMTVRPTGYFHKKGCGREEVDEALASLEHEDDDDDAAAAASKR